MITELHKYGFVRNALACPVLNKYTFVKNALACPSFYSAQNRSDLDK